MERRIKSQSIVATILFMAILASILFLFLTTEKNIPKIPVKVKTLIDSTIISNK